MLSSKRVTIKKPFKVKLTYQKAIAPPRAGLTK